MRVADSVRFGRIRRLSTISENIGIDSGWLAELKAVMARASRAASAASACAGGCAFARSAAAHIAMMSGSRTVIGTLAGRRVRFESL